MKLGLPPRVRGSILLNVIMTFVADALAGKPIPLATLAVFLGSFLLYRILGKHIDELYSWFRGSKSDDKKKIITLQALVIDEMRRADETRNFADKFIRLANEKDWLLVLANRRIAELEKRLNDPDSGAAA
jgi:hypothetical protein